MEIIELLSEPVSPLKAIEVIVQFISGSPESEISREEARKTIQEETAHLTEADRLGVPLVLPHIARDPRGRLSAIGFGLPPYTPLIDQIRIALAPLRIGAPEIDEYDSFLSVQRQGSPDDAWVVASAFSQLSPQEQENLPFGLIKACLDATKYIKPFIR